MRKFVGIFNEADISKGLDQEAVQKAMEKTDLRYTDSQIVYNRSGKPVGIKLWVCDLDEFRI